MNHTRYVMTLGLVIAGLAACHQHETSRPSVSNLHMVHPRVRPDLSFLASRYADKFPDDVYFWADPAVRSRLEPLLGDKLPVFLGSVQMKSRILNRQNILMVTGFNVRDRLYAAAFAFDLQSGAMYVRLRERGRDSEYPASGPPFPLPLELKSYCDSWSSWPESVAWARGQAKVSDEPVIGTLQLPPTKIGATAAGQPPPAASAGK